MKKETITATLGCDLSAFTTIDLGEHEVPLVEGQLARLIDRCKKDLDTGAIAFFPKTEPDDYDSFRICSIMAGDETLLEDYPLYQCPYDAGQVLGIALKTSTSFGHFVSILCGAAPFLAMSETEITDKLFELRRA